MRKKIYISLIVFGVCMSIGGYLYFNISTEKRLTFSIFSEDDGASIKNRASEETSNLQTNSYDELLQNSKDTTYKTLSLKASKILSRAMKKDRWIHLDDVISKAEAKNRNLLNAKKSCVLGLQKSYVQRLKIAKLVAKIKNIEFNPQQYKLSDLELKREITRDKRIQVTLRQLEDSTMKTLKSCKQISLINSLNSIYFLAKIALTKPVIPDMVNRRKVYMTTLRKLKEALNKTKKSEVSEESEGVLKVKKTQKSLRKMKKKFKDNYNLIVGGDTQWE